MFNRDVTPGLLSNSFCGKIVVSKLKAFTVSYKQPSLVINLVKLMPELRDVKGTEAIAAFIKAGGIRRQGKGDHINIKMPNGQLITIPSKGNVKVGLLKAAIKKAGLTTQEFSAYLGR